LFSQTSDAGDEVAGDPHVVVLEDEDPAAELVRARPAEDLLDDLLPGPVGRVGLPRIARSDRPVLVPEDAAQPIEVG
jgi:hypothetical protein